LVEEAELASTTASGLAAETPALPELDAATFQHLQTALTWRYAFDEATKYKAKTSVTALRRRVDEALDDEAQPLFPSGPATPGDCRQLGHGRTKLTAAQIGTAHHKFLQQVQLDQTLDLNSLRAEADRLATAHWLEPDERAVLDLPAIAGFWQSAAGNLIRSEAAAVRREQPFTARFTPAELASLLALPLGSETSPDLAGEFVVIQGVADLLVLRPKEIWLVDFKTDSLAPGELADKVRHYTPQIKLYAAALTKIYALPVTRRWLHFLALNETKDL
jgi:ATP-dependent helicase/nuclease subunit A